MRYENDRTRGTAITVAEFCRRIPGTRNGTGSPSTYAVRPCEVPTASSRHGSIELLRQAAFENTPVEKPAEFLNIRQKTSHSETVSALLETYVTGDEGVKNS